MEIDSKTIAVLVLIFVIAFKLIWTLLKNFDDVFDDFWQEIKRKDVEDEEDDRHQSGKK